MFFKCKMLRNVLDAQIMTRPGPLQKKAMQESHDENISLVFQECVNFPEQQERDVVFLWLSAWNGSLSQCQ